MAREDFISAYFEYVGATEVPATFHRWASLSLIGAYLGRNYTFQHGHFRIKPNMYCMLMGDAGSRKTTAIKIASRVLRIAGYDKIAASRVTKEKFLLDLAGVEGLPGAETKKLPDDIMEFNLWGTGSSESPEVFIAADEFNLFVGNGNIEFLSLLGVLWDYEGEFSNRVKNSQSITFSDPVVSILAGNTATNFSLAFPVEAIGQGIFSRLLLVYGERTATRIAFPVAPSDADDAAIAQLLANIKAQVAGVAKISETAHKALEHLYLSWTGLTDVRFESYSNRRFTHLLKLCLIVSAAAWRDEIQEEDVIYANTILAHAEHTMPKALGEFGKSKNSDIAHKVLVILESHSSVVVTKKELWMQLHNDLNSVTELGDILANLIMADKVEVVKGGYVAKRKVMKETNSTLVDFSLLTEEERSFIAC